MTSPIERFIDAIVRCVYCGVQGVGNCTCRETRVCKRCKQVGTAHCRCIVVLVCDRCGATCRAARIKDDPAYGLVVSRCPDCVDRPDPPRYPAVPIRTSARDAAPRQSTKKALAAEKRRGE